MGGGPTVLPPPALFAVEPYLDPWLWVSQGTPEFVAGLLRSFLLDLLGSPSSVSPRGQVWKMVLWSLCAHRSPSQSGENGEVWGTVGP